MRLHPALRRMLPPWPLLAIGAGDGRILAPGASEYNSHAGTETWEFWA
jgi:hypothetical protein